jgi:hypothetical protein
LKLELSTYQVKPEEAPFVEDCRPPSALLADQHPESYRENQHHLQHVEQTQTCQQTGASITPQQALTALIQSSEPIQDQINKYFAELKRSSEKRSDLILQLGLKKRTDNNKKKRSAGRGRKGAKGQDPSCAFSPSLSSGDDGPSFKSSEAGARREDEWGRVGSSNDDSQESSDDLGPSAAVVQAGGSIVVRPVHPSHDHAGVIDPGAVTSVVGAGGYGLVHVSSSTGGGIVATAVRPPSSEMFFMGIASPPPSPGVEIGTPADLGIHIARYEIISSALCSPFHTFTNFK